MFCASIADLLFPPNRGTELIPYSRLLAFELQWTVGLP